MRNWVNTAFRWYLHQRYKGIEHFNRHPHKVQERWLMHLLHTARNSIWGQQHDFASLRNASDFASRVPLQDYESLKPFIERMMHGEKDVLWSGQVRWFSKSSGTTNDKSKFIPVSTHNFKKCHSRGSWDSMTLYYHQRPYARQFRDKVMLMGGSLQQFKPYPKTMIGDVSAIMIQHLPLVTRPFIAPDVETALLADWEEKVERMARYGARERDIVMIAGVPTWTVVLFRRILEITGKQHMLEVWPKFQLYMHGGVSFTPYQPQFRDFFPSDQVDYMEIYNASEGYFAAQDRLDEEGMLLLLNNGIFYEFLPMDQWGAERPLTLSLREVEIGKNYAIVISTNSGLWRYLPGDTITFTSLSPYRIKVTGRTKQFVNAFGEEVMVENTDRALALTCERLRTTVVDYTVAPVYFEGQGRGSHEWLVEFERQPNDLNEFEALLDENLQRINSDYEAKRYKNMALSRLKVRPLPAQTFYKWMRYRGKFGGQHKVPRLANHRQYVEEILEFLEERV
jgi:hypothetical protein